MKKFSLYDYKIKLYLSIIVLSAIVSACSNTTAPHIISDDNGQQPNNVTPLFSEEAYPIKNSSITEFAYPNPSSSIELVPPTSAYPAPSKIEEFKEPRFRFDLPLTTESTSVSGQAPPNLTIAIVDITFNGIVLGSGKSDDNGRFHIAVQPLPQGHRIGITFADLQPEKSFDEMSIEYYPHRGDGFMNLPNVGIFFDTTLVE